MKPSVLVFLCVISIEILVFVFLLIKWGQITT